ncbi:MAG: hypothetical protein RL367_2296 [Pseudomonadota bacterium]|jgi:predicted Fe-S protein YdhL (DUF1289 family)
MSLFPVIQSPCPLKGNRIAMMQGDVCTQCNRQVFELNHMTDRERMSFMKSCSGEVCVSYRLPLKRAMAAAALTAAALPMAVAAQQAAVQVEAAPIEEDFEIFEGGIKDPAHVAYVESAADLTMPELPVVYEDGPPPESGKTPAY